MIVVKVAGSQLVVRAAEGASGGKVGEVVQRVPGLGLRKFERTKGPTQSRSNAGMQSINTALMGIPCRSSTELDLDQNAKY